MLGLFNHPDKIKNLSFSPNLQPHPSLSKTRIGSSSLDPAYRFLSLPSPAHLFLASLIGHSGILFLCQLFLILTIFFFVS